MLLEFMVGLPHPCDPFLPLHVLMQAEIGGKGSARHGEFEGIHPWPDLILHLTQPFLPLRCLCLVQVQQASPVASSEGLWPIGCLPWCPLAANVTFDGYSLCLSPLCCEDIVPQVCALPAGHISNFVPRHHKVYAGLDDTTAWSRPSICGCPTLEGVDGTEVALAEKLLQLGQILWMQRSLGLLRHLRLSHKVFVRS